MLKEMILKMVKEPEFMTRIQNGQLQLAGVSSAEQRALFDIMKERKAEPVSYRQGTYWF
ncbi:competence pheromone ComX [Paenibacillus sp.]|uniref:competence pheromone ComX n=1 Tax=Paenibacillus sp. TaxID=58172 RepID=UPI0028307BC1|nr:competence pheromone ComX [Paenibacillus sp.]MDR0268521.1 competence pheromone ComX [Paenibacillus sp.]